MSAPLGAYKRGLQLAISRGDLDLARRVYEGLRAIDLGLHWVRESLLEIACKNCWPFVGECMTDRDLWETLTVLTLVPKNKDALALASYLSLCGPKYKHKELSSSTRLIGSHQKTAQKEISRAFFRKEHSLDVYAVKVGRYLVGQMNKPQTLFSHRLLMMTLLLVGTRNLPHQDLQDIKATLKKRKGKKGPLTWEAYLGDETVENLVKTKIPPEERSLFLQLIYHWSVHRISGSRAKLSKPFEVPSIHDSIWWALKLKQEFSLYKISVKESREKWDGQISPMLEREVRRIVK